MLTSPDIYQNNLKTLKTYLIVLYFVYLRFVFKHSGFASLSLNIFNMITQYNGRLNVLYIKQVVQLKPIKIHLLKNSTFKKTIC